MEKNDTSNINQDTLLTLDHDLNFNGITDEKITIEALVENLCQQCKKECQSPTDRGYFITRLKTVWFEKEIEDWKNKYKKDKDPDLDTLLYEIVKPTMTNRIVKAIQELKNKYPDAYSQMTIFLFRTCARIILNYSPCLTLLNVQNLFGRVSQPEKPFFIKKNNKLYCVSITKHYDSSDLLNQKLFNISIAAECGENNITIKFNKQSKDEDINEVIFEYNNKSKQKIIYKISLNEEGEIDKIIKENEDGENKDYKDEIKQLLYEDKDKDNINKHLIENIELELDSKQKEVFKKIKAYIGIKEVKEKKRKKKKDINKKKKDINNSQNATEEILIDNPNNKDIIFESTEEDAGCKCGSCDFGLQQIKECLGIT